MKIGLTVLMAGAMVGWVTNADARPKPPGPRAHDRVVDTPREARADRNHDGVVGPREAAAARRHAYLRKRSDVDRPWEQAADKNNDGHVDGAELRAYHRAKLDANGDGKIGPAERAAYWHRRWVVNTPFEKKYDKNGDGYLEWPEARELLKDKHTLILTDGQAKVDTDIELEFDANDDGVIDRAEAADLKLALDAAD
jgi:hypothetical protein